MSTHSELKPSLCRYATLAFTLSFFFTIVSVGCTRSRGEEARAQYVKVVEAVKGGSLTEAYAAAIPSQYDRDLNELLARLQALITAEEFDLLHEVVSKAGVKLAPMLSGTIGKIPFLRDVAEEKLKDLPGALGLGSYADFKERNIRGLLEGLDRGFFAELARGSDFQDQMASIDVELKASEGDWARLRFAAEGNDGAVDKELGNVILVGEKWVPESWVVDWPAQMEQLKARFDELEELKRKDPLVIKAQLRAFKSQLDNPAGFLAALLSKLGAG